MFLRTSFVLPALMPYQTEYIDKYRDGTNLMVETVPGGGKTDTVLQICQNIYQNTKEKILVLTCSETHRGELQKKVKKLKVDARVQVETFFSYIGYLTKTKVKDEDQLAVAIDKPAKKTFDFPYIVVDGVHNFNERLFGALCKIINNNQRKPTICITGDVSQVVEGSDARFMYNFDKVYNDKPWTRIVLNSTYRLPKPICDFVNNVVLKHERLISDKDGKKPFYMFIKDPADIASIIMGVLKENYKPEDIFVLDPSPSSNGTLKQVFEIITETNGKPAFYQETDSIPERKDLSGRIAFLNYEASAGLERKVVFISGFSSSYSDKKYNGVLTCPPPLYIALTRSTERMYLLHHPDDGFLSFIKEGAIAQFCEMKGKMTRLVESIGGTEKLMYTINSLLDPVDFTTLKRCLEQLEITKEEPSEIVFQLDEGDDLTANALETISISALAYYEYRSEKSVTISEIVGKYNKKKIMTIRGSNVRESIEHFDEMSTKIPIIASAFLAIKNDTPENAERLKEHILVKPLLEKMYERLKTYKLDDATFMEHCSAVITSDGLKVEIVDYVDCVDKENKVNYVFRCVPFLEDTHAVYLSLCKYLMSQTEGMKEASGNTFKVVNILTDEKWTVALKSEDSGENIARILIDAARKRKARQTDEEISKLCEGLAKKDLFLFD